jgi:ribonuclease HI
MHIFLPSITWPHRYCPHFWAVAYLSSAAGIARADKQQPQTPLPLIHHPLKQSTLLAVTATIMANMPRRWEPTLTSNGCPISMPSAIPHNVLYNFTSTGVTKLASSLQIVNDNLVARFPLQVHESDIFIAVDGACRGNQYQQPAGASYGVYYGEHSSFNKKGLLPDGFRLTNNVAELYAALVGLDFGDFVKAGGTFHQANDVYDHPRQQDTLRGIKRVIIMSDSSYLVRGMTEYILEWKGNGWKTYNGGPVANQELFRQLDAEMTYLESCGIEVRFWLVGREHNRGADRLANEALNQNVPAQAYNTADVGYFGAEPISAAPTSYANGAFPQVPRGYSGFQWTGGW